MIGGKGPAASGTAPRDGAEPAKRRAPWLVAPMVAMAAFMEVLDISIANVSLGHIAGSLAASRDQSTWILTSYLITNAIILPVSGWLSGTFGRKRFFLTCIVGFSVSSLMCGLATDLSALIAFRAIQGLTGGGLQPTAQAILADSFPGRERGMAFAFYGVAVVFAPAIGPTLGGWITDNYSWHWVFLINVPVGVVLYFLISNTIEDPPEQRAAREARLRRRLAVDYPGFALLALALGCLQVVLDKGQEEDWLASDLIAVCAAVSVVALAGFIVRELRYHEPIVDLRLFRNRSFATANFLMFMLGFVLLGSTALLPLFAQDVAGYTATAAGEVLSPGGFAIMVLMPVVGKLVGRVDPRLLIAFGLALTAYALWRMSGFTADVDHATMALDRVVQTCGLAFLFIPITTTAYAGVSPGANNAASSLINLARNLGGSVGIAVLTTVLARRTQAHRAMLVQNVSDANPLYQEMLGMLQERMLHHGSDVSRAALQAHALIARELERQAHVLAFADAFLLLATLFTLMIPLVFLLRRPGVPASGPDDAH